jgi:hypothetical protein
MNAQPTQVFAEIIRYSASTTGIGIAVGLAVALITQVLELFWRG